MPKGSDPVLDAVSHFWKTRKRQTRKQLKGVAADRGSRSAVTGGRHMDGFVDLVTSALVKAGCPRTSIHSGKSVELPGWFRAEKQWDLAVVHNGELIAAIEFKSHVGPSFGNNFNNRTEEAIGSSTDIWAAYREGAFKPSARPWLGYLMLLEDSLGSISPVSTRQPHFKVFPEFADASYRERYRLLIQKLVRERLYDAACLVLSPAKTGASASYSQPDSELMFERFVESLVARVSHLSKR